MGLPFSVWMQQLFGRANVSTRKLPEDEAIIRSLTGICAAFLGFATIVFTLIVVGFFAVRPPHSPCGTPPLQ